MISDTRKLVLQSEISGKRLKVKQETDIFHRPLLATYVIWVPAVNRIFKPIKIEGLAIYVGA